MVFYLVWREGSVPTHRHTARVDAEREAHRLALKCPGTKFFVLEAVTTAVKNEVHIERLDGLDGGEEIPF